MPIENRELKPGMRLVVRYHKQRYNCEVVEGEGGKLRYRLEDGREFKSPSAAGTAITGKACNGWAFWSVEAAQSAPATEVQQPEAPSESPVETPQTTEPTAAGPEKSDTSEVESAAPAEPTEEPGPAKKPLFRLPNQKGVPEGRVRWYCRECSQSFLVPAGETPEACPAGHRD